MHRKHTNQFFQTKQALSCFEKDYKSWVFVYEIPEGGPKDAPAEGKEKPPLPGVPIDVPPEAKKTDGLAKPPDGQVKPPDGTPVKPPAKPPEALKPGEKPGDVKLDPNATLKKPPEKSPSGQEIADKIKNMSPAERQHFLDEQFKNHNVTVNYIPRQVEMTDAQGKPVLDSQGKPITATYYVTDVAFGKDNPVYLPVAGATAARGAAYLGAVLPSSKITDDSEKGAFIPYITYEDIAKARGIPADRWYSYVDDPNNPGQKKKVPRGEYMQSPDFYATRDELLKKAMAERGLKPGDHFYGDSKNLRVWPRLENTDKTAIFGGRYNKNMLNPNEPPEPGGRVQESRGDHDESSYEDYTNIPKQFLFQQMAIQMDGKTYICNTADVYACGKRVRKKDGTFETRTLLGRTDLWRLIARNEDGPMDVTQMYRQGKLFAGKEAPPPIKFTPVGDGQVIETTAPLPKPAELPVAPAQIPGKPPDDSGSTGEGSFGVGKKGGGKGFDSGGVGKSYLGYSAAPAAAKSPFEGYDSPSKPTSGPSYRPAESRDRIEKVQGDTLVLGDSNAADTPQTGKFEVNGKTETLAKVGETSKWLLEQLDKILEDEAAGRKPRIDLKSFKNAVVLIGTNDIGRSGEADFTDQKIFDRIKRICEILSDKGIKVYVCTIPPFQGYTYKTYGSDPGVETKRESINNKLQDPDSKIRAKVIPLHAKVSEGGVADEAGMGLDANYRASQKEYLHIDKVKLARIWQAAIADDQHPQSNEPSFDVSSGQRLTKEDRIRIKQETMPEDFREYRNHAPAGYKVGANLPEEVISQAWATLSSGNPLGKETPLTANNGKVYIAIVEPHYHEPDSKVPPRGWHKGHTVYEPA